MCIRLFYERRIVRNNLPWNRNIIFGEPSETVISEISVKASKALFSENSIFGTLEVLLVFGTCECVM